MFVARECFCRFSRIQARTINGDLVLFNIKIVSLNFMLTRRNIKRAKKNTRDVDKSMENRALN